MYERRFGSISFLIVSLFLFQPRAREEEVAAGEGSKGGKAIDGVCESAPDGDQQQCDNCQHVTGKGKQQLSLKRGGWAELSMTAVTVTELLSLSLVGTKPYLE